MQRLQFEMWQYEPKPGEFDGFMSRFTDGNGKWTDSWWSSPPPSIDHVGPEYLKNPHRHPNVIYDRQIVFVKRRYKEEYAKLKAKGAIPNE